MKLRPTNKIKIKIMLFVVINPPFGVYVEFFLKEWLMVDVFKAFYFLLFRFF